MKKRNSLVHIITDFGPAYKAGTIQHLIALYQKALNGLEGTLQYVDYGTVDDFNVTEAAYLAEFAHRNINPNTINEGQEYLSHGLLLVVDPTVGNQNGHDNSRDGIAFILNDGVYGVAPDNGLLTKLQIHPGIADVRKINREKIREFTELDKQIAPVWDAYFLFSPALALFLATGDLNQVGYEGNVIEDIVIEHVNY